MNYRHETYKLVMQRLKSPEKACQWFKTPNPLLGGIKPDDLLEQDKGEKLMQFIEDMINDLER